jgi:hypothetical protein
MEKISRQSGCRWLLRVLCATIVMFTAMLSAHAQTDLVRTWDGGDWIVPVAGGNVLYGANSPNADFAIAQWGNPSVLAGFKVTGCPPGRKNCFVAASPNITDFLYTDLRGNHWIDLLSLGTGIPCHPAVGYELGNLQTAIGPVYRRYPQGVLASANLGKISQLVLSLTGEPIGLATLQGAQCSPKATGAGMLVGLVFNNPRAHQTLFYQLRLQSYLTGRFEEQQLRRSFRTLDFLSTNMLSEKRALESLAAALEFSKSKIVDGVRFLLAKGESVAALLHPAALDDFIEQGEEWADSIDKVYLPFPAGKAFDLAKEQLIEAWPPLIKAVEIKLPMKDGFNANLDYFRLDFLDRSMVEIGGKLADILPALWLMAGCRGKLPTCKGSEKMLFFNDCPFAVLIDESAIRPFLAKLEQRPDIDWAFLVANDQDSFSRMYEWLPEHVPAAQRIHLWRNYIDNFLINVDHGFAGDAP